MAWHEPIAFINFNENIIESVLNRPLQQLLENDLYNKLAWENWLLNPVLSKLTVNGSIIVTGTVDGVDISTFKTSFDNVLNGTTIVPKADKIDGFDAYAATAPTAGQLVALANDGKFPNTVIHAEDFAEAVAMVNGKRAGYAVYA